jgi:hypothetical protein
MYQGQGSGIPPIAGGAVLLPNTGGNLLLTIVAITGIVLGTVIIVSSLARLVAKKAFSKA